MKPPLPLTLKAYENPKPVENTSEAEAICTRVYDENIEALFYDYPEKDDFMEWIGLYRAESNDTAKIAELNEKIKTNASAYAPFLEQFSLLCHKYIVLCNEVGLNEFDEDGTDYTAKEVFADLENEICIRIRENLTYTHEIRDWRFNEQPPLSFKMIKLNLERFYVYLLQFDVAKDKTRLITELTDLLQGIKQCATGVINRVISKGEQTDKDEGLDIELSKMRATAVEMISAAHVETRKGQIWNFYDVHVASFYAHVAARVGIQYYDQEKILSQHDKYLQAFFNIVRLGIVQNLSCEQIATNQQDIDSFEAKFAEHYNFNTIIENLKNSILAILRNSSFGPSHEYIDNASKVLKKYNLQNGVDYALEDSINIDGTTAHRTNLIDDIDEYAETLAAKILWEHNLLSTPACHDVSMKGVDFVIIDLETGTNYRSFVFNKSPNGYQPATISRLIEEIQEETGKEALNNHVLEHLLSFTNEKRVAYRIIDAMSERCASITPETLYPACKKKRNEESLISKKSHVDFYWIDGVKDIAEIFQQALEIDEQRQRISTIRNIAYFCNQTSGMLFNISDVKAEPQMRQIIFKTLLHYFKTNEEELFAKIAHNTPQEKMTFALLNAALPAEFLSKLQFATVDFYLKTPEEKTQYAVIYQEHIKHFNETQLFKAMKQTGFSAWARDVYTAHPHFIAAMDEYIEYIVGCNAKVIDALNIQDETTRFNIQSYLTRFCRMSPGTPWQFRSDILRAFLIRAFNLNPSDFGQVHHSTTTQDVRKRHSTENPTMTYTIRMLVNGHEIIWRESKPDALPQKRAGHTLVEVRENRGNRINLQLITNILFETDYSAWPLILKHLDIEPLHIACCHFERLGQPQHNETVTKAQLTTIENALNLRASITRSNNPTQTKINIITAITNHLSTAVSDNAQGPSRKRRFTDIS